MTGRDRLIEILNNWGTENNDGIRVESVADYLIANGVILPPCKVGDTVYELTTPEEIKCIYCNTEPNNVTTKKGLYACTCYQLQKIGNEYVQYLKEGNEVRYKEKNGEYIEVD